MNKKKEELLDDFIYCIKEAILYWDEQDRDSKGKMEGLAFSILCMLDGVSGSFPGNIHKLAKIGSDFMFHDQLHKKDA